MTWSGEATALVGESATRAASRVAALGAAERAQIQRAHLVGNSLGGGVAIEFARYFPQRVESLALVAPVGLRLAKRTYVLTRAPTGRALPVLPPVLAALRARSTSGPTSKILNIGPWCRPTRGAWPRSPRSGGPRSRGAALPLRAAGGRPSRRRATLPRPVLVVWGDGDRTCPCAARDVRRLVPRADVVVVRGARRRRLHAAWRERARAVVCASGGPWPRAARALL